MTEKTLTVCVFFYNRPDFVEKCLDALSASVGSLAVSLKVFIDGPKSDLDGTSVQQVRDKVDGYDFGLFAHVEIIKSNINKGLAWSIITGVSKAIKQCDQLVVVEDDLIVTTNFLSFMHESLMKYKDFPNVGSVSGFSFPIYNSSKNHVYFHPRPTSWGWGTWSDRWCQSEWNVTYEYLQSISYSRQFFNTLGSDMDRMLRAYMSGTSDSWAIRWALAHKVHGWVAVTPYLSKVENRGFGDRKATNTRGSNNFSVKLDKTDFRGPYRYPEVVETKMFVVRWIDVLNGNLMRICQKVLPNSLWLCLCSLHFEISRLLQSLQKE